MFILTPIVINSSLTSKHQREWEEITSSILLSTCETNFSLQKNYLKNSNGDNVKKFVSKVVSKFHNAPTVNKFRIIVLLGQVLGVCGKRESSMQGTFLPSNTLSQNSQWWVCAKISSKPLFQIYQRSNGKQIRDCRFTETDLSV